MFKNKETVIGWLLIALLMIGFIFYQNKKMKEEQAQKKEKQRTEVAGSLKTNQKFKSATITAIGDTVAMTVDSVAQTSESDDSLQLSSEYGAFSAAARGEEKTFVIENDLQKITLTNKGGQIKSVELKNYFTWDKKPLILFTDKSNSLSYQFAIDNDRVIDTKNFYFEPVSEDFTVKGTEKKSFSFRLNSGDGQYFEQTYTLTGNSYMLDYNVNMVGLNTVIPSSNTFVGVNWNNTLQNLEHNNELERRYSALYYRFNQSDVTHLSEDKETDEYVFDAPVEWISFKQQFFNATLLSKGEFNRGKLKTNYVKEDKSYVKKYEATFTLPYKSADKTTYSFQYYFGPNNYNTLSSFDRDLQSIIKLSPDFWMFSWIKYITRFIIFVFTIFENLHWNYGIIILIMTLILKLVLHPLTAKSIESAAKMKILAPELAALKEKYGEDQGRMGQEQMKLYQRAGVSPLGGCLPLLLQMPILMAMYYFFPASIELRQEAFLWANDLSSYDAIYTWSTPIFGQNHLSLFTILMTITSIIQAVMNNQMNAMSNQQPGMQYIPYIMPVMLMFVFNSFPAALTYYYLLQNLFGVLHQWVIQKFFINEEKLRKQIEENKKNPKKPSGLMKRFADMQKEAEQKARERQKK
jgi:YidC/Oxa1 family membrane protein insertase